MKRHNFLRIEILSARAIGDEKQEQRCKQDCAIRPHGSPGNKIV